MPRMQWDESLSLGIPLIDDQHKTWIQRLNSLSEAIGARVGLSEAANTLDFLIEYTDFHFGTEEREMAASGYPGALEHRQKHQDLKNTLTGLLQDYEEDGATHRLVTAVDTFLQTWLIRHIREVDTRFARYLKETGSRLAAPPV
jgi:hemerythrin-like metal-binding protein